jgi:hypothetical protein
MKAVAQQLALVAMSTLLALVLMDLGYRWLIEPEAIVPKSVGRFDEQLGWALVPHASASSSATGKRIDYEINGKGLRDDEADYAKPSDTLRILLLGDSRTFGYGVPIEQHFTKLLEGYFRNVEVINMGVSGYGVDQELLALRKEGVRYQPDVVIAYVAHFGDQRHMFADRWGKPKPQFQLRDGELTLSNVPVLTEYAGLDTAHRVDLFLVSHSPLYREVSKAAIGLLNRAMGRNGSGSALAHADADPVFVDRIYELAVAILHQLDEESTAVGAKFVLVTQLPRLHSECAKLGIKSLDVSLPMRNPRFDLPRGFEHINEAGNGVIAHEIARFLTNAGLIPSSHRADSAVVEAAS